LHAADHSEDDVVDGDGLSQHGPAGKKDMGALEAQHNDAAALGQVLIADESAIGEGHKAHGGEVRLHAIYRAGGVGPGADPDKGRCDKGGL